MYIERGPARLDAGQQAEGPNAVVIVVIIVIIIIMLFR